MSYVDRIRITMVKLTDANKAALRRCGDLERLSLPDALFKAYECAENNDDTCRIQLLPRSAELLHPQANEQMALNYEFGDGVGTGKDLGLAVYHYRHACSRRHITSMFELMEHYKQENDRSSVLKYITMASAMPMSWWEWFQCIQFATAYNCDDAQLLQLFRDTSKSTCAFQESICHFFGVGRQKDYQKAIDALQLFDFGLSLIQYEDNNSNCFAFEDNFHPWDFPEFNLQKPTNRYETAVRRHAKFPMKKNQFLPSLVFIRHNEPESHQKLKRYAFHAVSNHCIEAHIIIAQIYSRNDRSNEREMSLQLQNAADAEHSLVQSICRRLFGGQPIMAKRVEMDEGERNDNERKRKSRLHGKQSAKEKKKSGTKRSERASKEQGIVAK